MLSIETLLNDLSMLTLYCHHEQDVLMDIPTALLLDLLSVDIDISC